MRGSIDHKEHEWTTQQNLKIHKEKPRTRKNLNQRFLSLTEFHHMSGKCGNSC